MGFVLPSWGETSPVVAMPYTNIPPILIICLNVAGKKREREKNMCVREGLGSGIFFDFVFRDCAFIRRNNPRRGEAVYEFPSDFDISVCMKEAPLYWHCVHLADDWHTCIVSPSAAISYVQLIFTQSLFFDWRKAASMHSHGCKRSWITPSDILLLGRDGLT